MTEKPPRPADPAQQGRNRAGETEGFGDAFNSPNSKPDNANQEAQIAPGIVFEIQYPNVGGSGAEHIRKAMRYLVGRALTHDGLRAFECPKSSAAVHEAGHCVIGALNGVIPSRATIWPVQEFGRPQWVGKTYGLPPLWVDDKTDAQADITHARSQLAGVVAESVFDPDYRVGSSTDEIAIATGILRTAATKMRCDPLQLLFETVAGIELDLKEHGGIVREIADELMRKGGVGGRRLQFLLQPIRVIGEPPPRSPRA
jgi:hypothetical protein